MIGDKLLAHLFLRQLIAELPHATHMRDAGTSGTMAAHRTNGLRRLYFDLIDDLDLPVLFEIGAHDGETSRQFVAARNGRQAFAFEANPTIFQRNEASAVAGLTFVNAAVGSHDGTITFRVPKDPRLAVWGSTRARIGMEQETDTFTVALTSLDTFIGATLPDLGERSAACWIDVEGGLLDVLRGAGRALSSSIAMVYTEVSDTAVYEGEATSLDLIEAFIAAGFVPLARDAQFPNAYNLLLVHESLLPATSSRYLRYMMREARRRSET